MSDLILGKYKYKVAFSSVLKPLVNSPKELQASLNNLRQFLPEIDEAHKIDFLPVAHSAYVVNHVNLNGVVVDTETALATYKLFNYTFINVEHSRRDIKGVNINAFLTRFSDESILTEEEAKKLKDPFNVTLGGIIWRAADKRFAKELEESNDPNSSNYQSISASFEVGFSNYDLVLIKGNSRNLADGEVISDPDKISELEKLTRTFGGNGKLDENTNIYLLIKGEMLPLGIGLTENPAAAVKGVATPEKEEKANTTVNINVDLQTPENAKVLSELIHKTVAETLAKATHSSSLLEKSEKTISHLENSTVKKNRHNMTKITKIEEITDEALKEIKASVIVDFLNEQILKANDEFKKSLTEDKDKIKSLETEKANLSKNVEDLNTKISNLTDAFNKLQEAAEAKEAEEAFQVRMASFDEKYNLTAEDRKIIASKIKGMSDEDYTAYAKEMEILLSAKLKTAKEVVASKTETQAVVESAVEKAAKVTAELPNTQSTNNTDELVAKYQKAFKVSESLIKPKR